MTQQPVAIVANSHRFVEAVTLVPVEPVRADRAFLAMPQWVPWPKAYGGDTVAQSAAAASATVDGDRQLHSMHSSFLRPVDINNAVGYEVEIIRDGRGYSTRHVRGYQNDRLVSISTASFQVPEDGMRSQPSAPVVTPPDSLPSSAEALRDHTGPAAEYWSTGRSFDMRHVPAPLYFATEHGPQPHQAVWVRAFDTLPDDAALHRIAIAYVCDYTILEPSLRGLGLNWSSPGLTTASLDHAIWFHNDARADEWLLYAQESGGVQSGRGLNTGRFFTVDGMLAATVAQEGLIRA